MKRITTILLGCLLLSGSARATNYTWTGAPGAKYSDPANWSNGVTGSIPGPGDAIIFSAGGVNQSKCLVDLDVSPTVAGITVGISFEAILVTSKNATLTITGSLTLYGSLTNSTSEDVRLNLVLDGASGSSVPVSPQPTSLRFAGRVPVSSGNGALFSLVNNAVLTIDNSCSLVFARNSG